MTPFSLCCIGSYSQIKKGGHHHDDTPFTKPNTKQYHASHTFFTVYIGRLNPKVAAQDIS